MNFTAEKKLVRAYHRALDNALSAKKRKALNDTITTYCTSDIAFWGVHPFNDVEGAEALQATFWQPLMTSFTRLHRREDIFFAGHNDAGEDGHDDRDRSAWVASMGHFVGLFDAPWLGIAPTKKLAFLRYGEFNRIAHGKICETALYIDIPHLARQAGRMLFPVQTAAHLVQPGPQTHDGVLIADAPPDEGAKTLARINSMITNICTWNSGLSLTDELALDWHPDMFWWGPEGIGATYTIERYAQQHAGPFRAAFVERSQTKHRARIAEGAYGGFFGRPNFTAVNAGGFLGIPANTTASEFRVIDIYRREGDTLRENWIFIDFLHWAKQQGHDLLPTTA